MIEAVAINRTGSKAVWTSDEPKLVVRNNIFLSTTSGINPSYLHLYLNSALGKRAHECRRVDMSKQLRAVLTAHKEIALLRFPARQDEYC